MSGRGSSVVHWRWRRLRTFMLAALVAGGMLLIAAGAASADAWPLTPTLLGGG